MERWKILERRNFGHERENESQAVGTHQAFRTAIVRLILFVEVFEDKPDDQEVYGYSNA